MNRKTLYILAGFLIAAIVIISCCSLFSDSLEDITAAPLISDGLVLSGDAEGEHTSDGVQVTGKIKNTLPIPAAVTIRVAFYDDDLSFLCYGTTQLYWMEAGSTQSYTVEAATTEAQSFAIISAYIS